MVYLEICERFPRRCLKLPMMVPTRSAAGLVLKHNRRTLLFHHSGRGHRHDEITAAKAVRRPPEVHLVAPSRFGAQTQSARLTFSPFWAPTPPSEKFPRRGLKWSRGSWAAYRWYLEGTVRVPRRSPGGLYITQIWSPRGLLNTHTYT